jgi:RNA polymerase sigma-70 factor (ECF subfamily)
MEMKAPESPTPANVEVNAQVNAVATGIIREQGPAILRYLRALLRDEDLASDAFSLTIEWIWRGVPSFRQDSSVRTWTFGIAWNAARRLREDPWFWRRQTMQSSTASRLAAELHTATQKTEQKGERLAELRRELNADEQNLLVLRIDQNLDWRDIADILAAGGEKVSDVALRKRFERTKSRIAKLARKRGLVE